MFAKCCHTQALRGTHNLPVTGGGGALKCADWNKKKKTTTKKHNPATPLRPAQSQPSKVVQNLDENLPFLTSDLWFRPPHQIASCVDKEKTGFFLSSVDKAITTQRSKCTTNIYKLLCASHYPMLITRKRKKRTKSELNELFKPKLNISTRDTPYFFASPSSYVTLCWRWVAIVIIRSCTFPSMTRFWSHASCRVTFSLNQSYSFSFSAKEIQLRGVFQSQANQRHLRSWN